MVEIIERSKWLVFAVAGTDRRRSFYWRAIARLRRAEMLVRRDARRDLPTPPVDIRPDRGFAICEGEAFVGGTRAVVDEVRRMASIHMPESVGVEVPEQFGVNLPNLSFGSPLVQFAVRKDLLASIASYLEILPILTGVQVMRASHLPGPYSGSQLFHCDHDDLRQVKAFVLCSEVSESNGPLTVVDATTSRHIKQELGYRYGGRSLRVPDERVNRVAPSASGTAFVGPPGRVLLVDTSTCLHFGARIAEGAADRLMVQFQYLTPAAFDLLFQPGRRRISEPGVESSALQRLVLGATSRDGHDPRW